MYLPLLVVLKVSHTCENHLTIISTMTQHQLFLGMLQSSLWQPQSFRVAVVKALPKTPGTLGWDRVVCRKQRQTCLREPKGVCIPLLVEHPAFSHLISLELELVCLQMVMQCLCLVFHPPLGIHYRIQYQYSRLSCERSLDGLCQFFEEKKIQLITYNSHKIMRIC